MRSIKREAKGISPVIATILLIAVTAVAGGVIAAYVAGLYVSPGRLIIAAVEARVYDYDNSAALENYKNGVASMEVILQPGSGTMRNIGDPAYGGTVISVTNPRTGFTASGSYSLTENWGKAMTTTVEVNVTAWGTADDNDVLLVVTVTPSSTGTLGPGDMISIMLQPFSIADGHSYEISGDRDIRENRVSFAGLWTSEDTFNVTISGRDSLSLVGYDGAYLSASRWTE